MYKCNSGLITSSFTLDATKLDASDRKHLFLEADRHQIAFRKGTCSAGTATIKVKPAGATTFEDLTIGGVPVSQSMASDWTFGLFDGLFEEIKVDVAGANGNFTLLFSGK